jgi:hypothetical protein
MQEGQQQMITVVLPRSADSRHEGLPKKLLQNPLIHKVIVLETDGELPLPPRCEALACDDPASGRTWNTLFSKISTRYLLYCFRTDVRIDPRAPDRLLAAAAATGAGIVYADYAELRGEALREHPLNDYQMGSIRDGFDFGPLILISTVSARRALRKYGELPPSRWAGWYGLRLKISTDRGIFHLPERLSVMTEAGPAGAGGIVKAGGGHFAYVDPQNRSFQDEMEEEATAHLKRIGAWLAPSFRDVPISNRPFPAEASVVIPVRNRARTVADAVNSALAQRTDFPFNVIVADNHSTDRTTTILADLAGRHSALKHIVPKRRDLSIGGCWNEAIFSEACGRYAVQLDSDDLYPGDHVLQRLVDALRRGNCALVVGSYTIVDENLKEIPPGLIDHREWTDENGRNNALRVNGLGAPRAFDTAILRGIGFPNVGYGEDYAVALRLSREYRIGRIYESLYLCRRWEGNTDAALSVEQANRNDAYKDRLRTIEIQARRRMNGASGSSGRSRSGWGAPPCPTGSATR